MQDKLIIITKVKQLIEYIDNILINFPTIEKELKTNIINKLYELLETLYFANIDIDNRKEYQIKSLVYIKMLDYYINISFNKKLINYKKYYNIGNKLLEITKMIYKWINNNEKN